MNIDELLEGLRAPECYPGRSTTVEIIQTHLSIVCLVGDRVYKLKKAITLPFVDFAPLEARRQACRDEVRLNRRLCPQMYLGTSALRRVDGKLRLAELGDDEGPGDLDVAVVMRRLPRDRMLDVLVGAGTVTDEEIRGLARVVAAFHRDAERGEEVRELGAPAKLVGFAGDNFEELLARPDHGLPPGLLAQLQRASASGFQRLLPELEERAASGRVLDGHGDLHARNVCMTDPVTIYDCIEFEPAFRCGDAATEVAFLAMDLRYRSAPRLAQVFVEAYARESGDERLPELLPMLCSYRAMVRSKVASLTAAEAELSGSEREAAGRSAVRHLFLASACALESEGPLWILVCGPPASGKSWLCRKLHALGHWPHLATDVVRKQLAGIEPTAHASAEHYTAEFSGRTYAELLRLATVATESGCRGVLLDGNFPTPAHRRRAVDAAREAGARLAIVHVGIDLETALQRARARQSEEGNVSDADPSVARQLHGSFVPPRDDEVADWLDLDGTAKVESLCVETMTWLVQQMSD